MNNLIAPGQIVNPFPKKFVPVQAFGPYVRGELHAWKGIHLQTVSLMADGETCHLVLVPHSPTRGHIKRVTGKKGKPRTRRARARYVLKHIAKPC